jgi:agmatinase
MSCSRDIRLLGLPYEGPEDFIEGASLAPERIRWARESLEDSSFILGKPAPELDDRGDLDLRGKTGEPMVEHAVSLLHGTLKDSSPCLFLGGNHLVTLPAVRFYEESGLDFDLIHLDAHLDRRDVYKGSRFAYATVIRRIEELIGPDRVHTFGYRTRAEEEPETGVPFEVANPLVEFLGSRSGPFYLSVDLDVLDPSVFPAVTNPEPCGITIRELSDALRHLEGRLIAADIVEYNPQSCTDLHSAVTAAFVMRELSLCFGP